MCVSFSPSSCGYMLLHHKNNSSGTSDIPNIEIINIVPQLYLICFIKRFIDVFLKWSTGISVFSCISKQNQDKTSKKYF